MTAARNRRREESGQRRETKADERHIRTFSQMENCRVCHSHVSLPWPHLCWRALPSSLAEAFLPMVRYAPPVR
jgi:hypothetical protein